jgi:hypothetical protein
MDAKFYSCYVCNMGFYNVKFERFHLSHLVRSSAARWIIYVDGKRT